MKAKIKKKTPKSKNAKLVNKAMTFAEIMKKNPKAAIILMEEGMHCVGCHLSASETLEQGAVMHGINPDKLVNKINRQLNKK
jgi:hybrid cluster-associated redox disulfide protein